MPSLTSRSLVLPFSLIAVLLIGLTSQCEGRAIHVSTDKCIIPQLDIPSFGDECLPLCQPILQARHDCSNAAPCLCQRSPPRSIHDCLQCILKSLGEYSDYVYHYLASTQSELKGYAAICGDSDSIMNFDIPGLNHTRLETLISSANRTTTCITDSQSYNPFSDEGTTRDLLHILFPYLSFACALTLLVMVRLYR